jgi:HEPN domain-containing protein
VEKIKGKKGLGAGLAMNSKEETAYRFRLAKGYLEEAEQLFHSELWRACAGSCQLAVENACKTVIALFRPLARTHELSEHLLDLLKTESFSHEETDQIRKLADHARVLGLKEHVVVDYGDELMYQVPWEIYKEKHARRALEIATSAVRVAERFIET